MAWSPIQIPYIDTFISIRRSRSCLPSSLDHGFGDRPEDKTSAFHSISSSRSWKAMGLARGTFVDYVAMKLFAIILFQKLPKRLQSADIFQANTSVDEDAKYPKLVCSSCKNYLGHIDHQAEGYRLYKWRLKSSETSLDQPSLSSMITAQLQSIMLAQCCSRLVLLPINWKRTPPTSTTSPSSFLTMWILSPTIRYSTTVQGPSESTCPGTLAMKIFWKSISVTEANKLMESSAHEEVSLPAETILEIQKCLRDSASFLPLSSRKFQDWDVGLLRKFDGEG